MTIGELITCTEELEGILENESFTGNTLKQTLDRIRGVFDGNSELKKIFGHDGGNFGDVCGSYASRIASGKTLEERDKIILMQTLHNMVSVLWSINLSAAPNQDVIADIHTKTQKTLELSEFLRKNLPFVLYAFITDGNYRGKYASLYASKGDEAERIIGEIIGTDNPLLTLTCPGDMANFMANAVSNSKKRGYAGNVEIQYHNGILSILDDGIGIDEARFPDANTIFNKGESGSGSSGLGMRDLEKRQIRATAEHHGGLQTRQAVTDYFNNTGGLTPLPPGNRGAAIRIVLNLA